MLPNSLLIRVVVIVVCAAAFATASVCPYCALFFFRFLFLQTEILVVVVIIGVVVVMNLINKRKASFITLKIGEKFFSMRSFPLGFPRSPRSTHLT